MGNLDTKPPPYDFLNLYGACLHTGTDEDPSIAYAHRYGPLVEFYLQWRRRYRGYRYSGTFFVTLYMSQLVL
jgi:hypothetical protein